MGQPVEEKGEIRQELTSLPPSVASTWLIAIRTAMVSVGLLSSTIHTFFFKGGESWVFQGFAFLFLVNAVLAIWSKVKQPEELFIGMQLVFDCVVVSCILFITGGPHSPFLFLYLPFQLIGTTFLRASYSLVLAGLISSLYLCVCIVHESQPSPEALDAVTNGRLVMQWGAVTIALFLVHMGTARVRVSLLSAMDRAQSSLRTARSLQENFAQLAEGMGEAVLVVDSSGFVTSANRAAEELFRFARSEVIGDSLRDVSVLLEERFSLEKKLSEYKTWDEFTLLPEGDDGEERRVVLHRNERRTGDGSGYVTFYLFQDVTQLRTVEEQLALQERMARSLSEDERGEGDLSAVKIAGFVGESPVMKKLFRLIERVSTSDATVLVAGESGTGKELVAKAIHLQSARSRGPFIAVNCGAIPEQLLESELFGHKKGSFTGAISDHPGMFSQAIGGTLFLDEIGEMPLPMQAKLLRAIQEKVIRPVGAKDVEEIDVRIIAATNRELREEVAEGRFREDLYYRLNVIQMKLPPLRERREDVPVLIQSILKRLSHGSAIPLVPPQTLQLLMDYRYPGNVRELENVLERALVLGGEAILPEHLPENIREPEVEKKPPTEIIVREDVLLPIELDSVLADIEQHYLRTALQQSDGVKKNAAKLLGMNFRSFRYRLQKFGLNENESEASEKRNAYD
ncbi:sigma 54-interacting transcriptional regulator [bacterium]|nr:sigma 54-interacting transcriptional regulator [bacterium]